jgi:hypothetical protein
MSHYFKKFPLFKFFKKNNISKTGSVFTFRTKQRWRTRPVWPIRIGHHGEGYRWVYSNGGVVISRENVIICCLVRVIDGYRAMVKW